MKVDLDDDNDDDFDLETGCRLVGNTFHPIQVTGIKGVGQGVDFIKLDQRLFPVQVTGAAVAPGPFTTPTHVGFYKAVDIEAAVHKLGRIKAPAVSVQGLSGDPAQGLLWVLGE